MIQFSNSNIEIADEADIMSIVKLLNSAYRGERSKKGWTTEAHIIAGDRRTDAADLKQLMQQPGSVFLKYTSESEITGCVNLQYHNRKIYLGMLSVSPNLQGGGLGKQLLSAAEEYTRYVECYIIYMSVISVRSELIDWYKRHGYLETGERKPFIEDELTGKHLQPLEFIILQKELL
ncbi:MAG: GNAT family N-acetyltransferase [Chitinophagaceae bacterium]